MSKPFICGDEPAVFVPGEACECNYSMKKLDATEFYDPRYSLTLDGSSVGTPIEVPTLANYYNKTEVDALLNAIDTGQFIVVQSLPAEGQDKAIYLVPHTGSTPDAYDEYIWVNNAWELIGSTSVDLSNYYTKAEVDSELCDQFPVGSVYITSTNSNPSAYLCGTWQLYKKDLAYGYWANSGITWNTTFTSDQHSYVHRTPGSLHVLLDFKNKVAISDDEVTICTINLSNFGITSAMAGQVTINNDGLNAVGLGGVSSSGVVDVRDWVTRATSYPTTTNSAAYADFTIFVPAIASRQDSACDTFYWRRTA